MRSTRRCEDKKLSPEQEAAIAALLEGQSLVNVAQAVGVEQTVLEGWLDRDAAFVARLNRTRRRVFDESDMKQDALRTEAWTVLAERLADPADPSAQLEAASLVLRLTAGRERPSGPTSPDAAELSLLLENM